MAAVPPGYRPYRAPWGNIGARLAALNTTPVVPVAPGPHPNLGFSALGSPALQAQVGQNAAVTEWARFMNGTVQPDGSVHVQGAGGPAVYRFNPTSGQMELSNPAPMGAALAQATPAPAPQVPAIPATPAQQTPAGPTGSTAPPPVPAPYQDTTTGRRMVWDPTTQKYVPERMDTERDLYKGEGLGGDASLGHLAAGGLAVPDAPNPGSLLTNPYIPIRPSNMKSRDQDSAFNAAYNRLAYLAEQQGVDIKQMPQYAGLMGGATVDLTDTPRPMPGNTAGAQVAGGAPGQNGAPDGSDPLVDKYYGMLGGRMARGGLTPVQRFAVGGLDTPPDVPDTSGMMDDAGGSTGSNAVVGEGLIRKGNYRLEIILSPEAQKYVTYAEGPTAASLEPNTLVIPVPPGLEDESRQVLRREPGQPLQKQGGSFLDAAGQRFATGGLYSGSYGLDMSKPDAPTDPTVPTVPSAPGAPGAIDPWQGVGQPQYPGNMNRFNSFTPGQLGRYDQFLHDAGYLGGVADLQSQLSRAAPGVLGGYGTWA